MESVRSISVAVIVACCLMAMSGGADGISATKNDLPEKEKCREAIRISRHDNPWKGMTGSYAQEQENKSIGSAPIGADDAPVPALEKYKIGGERLMAKKAGTRKIVVNEKYFSALKKADATNIGAGQKQRIGVYLDRSFAFMTPRRLVDFLLDAQIITTYWHVEAQLCRGEEVENDGEYRARFTGRHVYYTNRREEQKLDFIVRIDRTTGEMTLIGGR